MTLQKWIYHKEGIREVTPPCLVHTRVHVQAGQLISYCSQNCW